MVRYLYQKNFFSAAFLIDLGLLLLSVFLFVMASDYPDMARTFPRLVLLMIMVFVILDLLNSLRRDTPKSEYPQGIRPRQPLKVLYMVGLMFLFFICMFLFGLVLGTLIFLVFSGWTLGYRKLKPLVLSAVVITAFVYTIFCVIMKSFLPQGLIFTITGG
jgi:hypothetical protein